MLICQPKLHFKRRNLNILWAGFKCKEIMSRVWDIVKRRKTATELLFQKQIAKQFIYRNITEYEKSFHYTNVKPLKLSV